MSRVILTYRLATSFQNVVIFKQNNAREIELHHYWLVLIVNQLYFVAETILNELMLAFLFNTRLVGFSPKTSLFFLDIYT